MFDFENKECVKQNLKMSSSGMLKVFNLLVLGRIVRFEIVGKDSTSKKLTATVLPIEDG